MAQPEQQAREEIDRLLTSAGWRVADLAEANIHAARKAEADINANLTRALVLRQAILSKIFQPDEATQ